MIKYKTGGSPFFEIGDYRFSFSNPDLHSGKDQDKWKYVTITGPSLVSYAKKKGKGKGVEALGKDVPRTTVKATTFTSAEGAKQKGPTKDMFGGDAKLRNEMKKVFAKWGKKSKDEYIHKDDLKGLYDDIKKTLKKHNAIEESLIDKIDLILGE